jgi:hypothetical protein
MKSQPTAIYQIWPKSEYQTLTVQKPQAPWTKGGPVTTGRPMADWWTKELKCWSQYPKLLKPDIWYFDFYGVGLAFDDEVYPDFVDLLAPYGEFLPARMGDTHFKIFNCTCLIPPVPTNDDAELVFNIDNMKYPICLSGRRLFVVEGIASPKETFSDVYRQKKMTGLWLKKAWPISE